MEIDRRKFVRHEVLSDTIQLLSNYSAVKGWVTDISLGGLAFEYYPPEGCVPKPEIRVIITSDKPPFYLPDIPCNTIYNRKIDKNHRIFKSIRARHYGLQFKEPDSEIKDKLTDLLKSDIFRPGS